MPSDSIVGSGSVQSHLSALNSHSRHREHARPPVVSDNTKVPADLEPTKDCSQFLASLIRGSLKDPLLPGPDGSLPRQRVWPNSYRWIISVYVVVSLIFFSTSLYRSFHLARLDQRPSLVPSQDRSPILSGLDALSPAARLAKLFALYPPPTHFGLFTHRPVVDAYSHEITVCLWAHENDLDWVPAWTTDWSGNDLHHSYIVPAYSDRSDFSYRIISQAAVVDSCPTSPSSGSSSPLSNAQCLSPRFAHAPPRSNDARCTKCISEPSAALCAHAHCAPRPWHPSTATVTTHHHLSICHTGPHHP